MYQLLTLTIFVIFFILQIFSNFPKPTESILFTSILKLIINARLSYSFAQRVYEFIKKIYLNWSEREVCMHQERTTFLKYGTQWSNCFANFGFAIPNLFANKFFSSKSYNSTSMCAPINAISYFKVFNLDLNGFFNTTFVTTCIQQHKRE